MTKKKLLKALAVAAIATSLVACSDSSSSKDKTTTEAATNSGSSVATVAPAVSSTDDTVTKNASYTIGYGMGATIEADKNVKSYNLNNDKIVEGFSDALNAKKPAISPEEIAKNMDTLRNKVQQKMSEERVSSFLKVKDSIYGSDLTPKSDIKDPEVVVYEFFDYQCMYCSKLAPQIEKVMQDNSNVQVVFAEFPIFGERAPASEYAAEVGTAIYKLYGADAYVKYHNGIFATGEDEGKLKDSTIDKVAVQSGADLTKVKKAIKDDKIANHLKDTLKLGFESLGIQGTPFLVIAPAVNANADNTTVIGGYTDADNIQSAIDKAKTAPKTVATTDNTTAVTTPTATANDTQAQSNVTEAPVTDSGSSVAADQSNSQDDDVEA
ncbi:DsbA family protein [Francisella philomiragia]|uniref:Domain amino terminal to FKBP-type peptidyl-prolyl isomerase family protein n=1 Tax=Francisella philomiragia TaxID=28110 RepID=A0A0B6D9C9_9GAMM|nr:DsbA family protein [Francisella philomiragia]AJI54263.1 domain amino terminal to FKBP-type peptidyl-prolyl isomerase family protein [Francisella philomiragia]MBY7733649.1 DsbA family protein [Francisella philomiragia]